VHGGVVGQVLTLWLQLNADAASTVLRGIPAWGIVGVNLSVVVVGVVTIYLQLREDKRLEKLRQRIRAINIRRRMTSMRQRSMANLGRMASFKISPPSVVVTPRPRGLAGGRLPSFKGAWWAEEEDDGSDDDDELDFDTDEPLPAMRRISVAFKRATSFRVPSGEEGEGGGRVRPMNAAFKRAGSFKRRVNKVGRVKKTSPPRLGCVCLASLVYT
jgi:hypothetical protein